MLNNDATYRWDSKLSFATQHLKICLQLATITVTVNQNIYYCLAIVLWTGQTKNCILSLGQCVCVFRVLSGTSDWFSGSENLSWWPPNTLQVHYRYSPLSDKLSAEDRSLKVKCSRLKWRLTHLHGNYHTVQICIERMCTCGKHWQQTA